MKQFAALGSSLTSLIGNHPPLTTFLGPISFINHDCNPNVQWHSRSKTESCVKAISTIHKGQELNVFYGSHYLGIDNCECLSRTCKLNEHIRMVVLTISFICCFFNFVPLIITHTVN